MKKTLLQILNYIGAIVLFSIIMSLGDYLLISKIINFQYDWVKYFYYLGLGILSFYPINYILNYYKKL